MEATRPEGLCTDRTCARDHTVSRGLLRGWGSADMCRGLLRGWGSADMCRGLLMIRGALQTCTCTGDCMANRQCGGDLTSPSDHDSYLSTCTSNRSVWMSFLINGTPPTLSVEWVPMIHVCVHMFPIICATSLPKKESYKK